MSCIKTYTGIMFDPLRPDADLIRISDIAHALSMLCRANGHFKSFYSVGQHSINCMKEAKARGCSRRIQLACLLHDASEAYLSDVTRPVKAELPKYKEIEAPLQNLIWQKYMGELLTPDEERLVFQIDDDMLAHEFLVLMDTQLGESTPTLASEPEFTFAGFAGCEEEFLRLFRRLTTAERPYFTVGIDWMKPYWLAAEIRGEAVSFRRYSHIREACDAYQDADMVLIDIPVGLPENAAEDTQRPDTAARKLLPGKRKASIFPVPCRQSVYADTEEMACAENERVLGRRLSKQAYGFSKMIRQVDTYLQQEPGWKNRLLESHPEVAFQLLNGEKGLRHSKHTQEGIDERIHILRSNGIEPPLDAFPARQKEDALDALSLALSAYLGCQLGFRTIPEKPTCDRRDIRMQMIFGKKE